MSDIMGKRLRYLRDKQGLAQKFVAEKIGVKNNTLSGYESGDRQPSSEILTRLADFYDVTTDYLHGRTDDPKGYATNPKNDFDPLAIIRDHIEKKGEAEQFGFFNIDEWKNLTPEQVDEILQDFDYMFQKAKKRNEEKK